MYTVPYPAMIPESRIGKRIRNEKQAQREVVVIPCQSNFLNNFFYDTILLISISSLHQGTSACNVTFKLQFIFSLGTTLSKYPRIILPLLVHIPENFTQRSWPTSEANSTSFTTSLRRDATLFLCQPDYV